MKIGIITSGLENIVLFNILQKYNHHYVIYWDQENFSYEDKSFDFVLEKIEIWIKELQKQWVEKYILHPIFELYFREKIDVLPLYENLVKEVFSHSIVWKIGLIGNKLDLENIDLSGLIEKYSLTERQKSIKKFNKWFKFYSKEVSLWKYYLLQLGKRDWMVRKTIKNDIKYYFDADVDSFLPTSWGVYAYDNILFQKKKKIHYQRLSKVEELNKYLLEEKQDKYLVDIIGTGDIDFFLKEKRWEWLIYRWKKLD